MPPGRPVGLLVDYKDTRPITISSTSESSSSGHPVDRTGAFKKRRIDTDASFKVKPGTSFTFAQLKQWEMAKKKKAAAAGASTKKVDHRSIANKVAAWSPQGPVIVKYIRAPHRPPTKVKEWMLHGFEEEWRLEQEEAWAEMPRPKGSWNSIEEWTRGVCDALGLWC